MSVIVKGMQMPQNCNECRFCEGYENGFVCAAFLNRIADRRHRLDTCPLEPQKTGHWKRKEYLDGSVGYVCSRCGSVTILAYHFCPTCGSINV